MLSILTVNFGHCTASGSPHKVFGTTITIISPQNNATYTGEVFLNVSIHFYIEDTVNSSIPPYQNISCIYQIDNNNWTGASLDSVSEQGSFWDWIHKIYWNGIDCNYGCLLQNLSSGTHILNVNICHDDSVTPMNGSSLKDSAVVFSVEKDLNQTEPNQSTIFTPVNFAISLIVTTVAVATLVVLFKKITYSKRLQNQSNA